MPPLPKPAAQRRRRNSPDTHDLPARRDGKTPRWPLLGSTPPGWAALWAMPQAVVWEREKLERVVARYVLVRDAAERPETSAAILAQALALEDRLLLSPYKLQQAHYRVATDEVAEKRSDVRSSRARLKVVDPALATGG